MFGALGSNDQYISDICYCHLLRTWSSKSTTWHMARHMLFFYWWLMPKILDMFGAKHLKKKFNNFILKRFFPLDNSNTRNLLVELLKSILKGFDIWKRKSILNNKSQFVKVNIPLFILNQFLWKKNLLHAKNNNNDNKKCYVHNIFTTNSK